jgi:hypothetical protein
LIFISLFSYDRQCEYYRKKQEKAGCFKKMECLTNSRGKKILWVRCPLIKKVGAGLYEKQNAYFADFQKRPSIFSYFSHNIQQLPMGYIIRKQKKINFSTQPPAITSSF